MKQSEVWEKVDSGGMQTKVSTIWEKPASVGVSIASGISFNKLSFRIGKRQILDEISFVVEPGEIMCLLGPSGSGKTSLMRIAAGLLSGSGGSIEVDGRTICDPECFVPPEKRGIGFVFQDFALFPHMNLRQNVEFGLTALTRHEAGKQAMRMLSRVGLGERAEQYPDVLSGGEQQRVALARALAPRPGILLMDEPFSGLDSRLRDMVRDQSLELLRETRSTAIIVTHDAEEALRVGDKMTLIRDGKLVQHGTARELYYNPVDLFTAGFFSEINVLSAFLQDGEIETVFGKAIARSPQTGAVKVAIRHSDIHIHSYEAGGPHIPGTIVTRRFLGTSELLDVRLHGFEQTIRIRVRTGVVGCDDNLVRLAVDPDAMMIFPS